MQKKEQVPSHLVINWHSDSDRSPPVQTNAIAVPVLFIRLFRSYVDKLECFEGANDYITGGQ